MKILDFAKTK